MLPENMTLFKGGGRHVSLRVVKGLIESLTHSLEGDVVIA